MIQKLPFQSVPREQREGLYFSPLRYCSLRDRETCTGSVRNGGAARLWRATRKETGSRGCGAAARAACEAVAGAAVACGTVAGSEAAWLSGQRHLTTGGRKRPRGTRSLSSASSVGYTPPYQVGKLGQEGAHCSRDYLGHSLAASSSCQWLRVCIRACTTGRRDQSTCNDFFFTKPPP